MKQEMVINGDQDLNNNILIRKKKESNSTVDQNFLSRKNISEQVAIASKVIKILLSN